jgi:carbonic anhydrase
LRYFQSIVDLSDDIDQNRQSEMQRQMIMTDKNEYKIKALHIHEKSKLKVNNRTSPMQLDAAQS